MRNGGENGFGYDPIFYLPDMSRTTAELSPEEKNSISHRGRALQAVKEDLAERMKSMRVLVVSDTHGHLENLERALEETGPVDALMHCGDIEGQEERIRRMIDGPCYMVAGQ